MSQSFAIDPTRLPQQTYKKVLVRLAQNCRQGPFTATSGAVLEYLLAAASNMFDRAVAASVTDLLTFCIQNHMLPQLKATNKPIVIVGPEMAGGVMVGQLVSNPTNSLPVTVSFCYLRKDRKQSGTRQQLEGPSSLTCRTPTSEPIDAIWVDDVISTGGSLRTGAELLKNDYNMNVVGALFLVDRSKDRSKPVTFPGISVMAVMDDLSVESHFQRPAVSKL